VSEDRPERSKLSFSELDRRRRGDRSRSDEPRGRAAQVEQARATDQALKDADALFSLGKGGARGAQLAKQIRDAHGSSDLATACRAYFGEVGLPDDPGLLALFLDTGEKELVVAALEGLLERKQVGSLEIGSGLRSQLRVLAQDRDDTIAGISEEILEA
jgi:hypothetical protein